MFVKSGSRTKKMDITIPLLALFATHVMTQKFICRQTQEVIKMPRYVVTILYRVAVTEPNEEEAARAAWEAVDDNPDGAKITIEEDD